MRDFFKFCVFVIVTFLLLWAIMWTQDCTYDFGCQLATVFIPFFGPMILSVFFLFFQFFKNNKESDGKLLKDFIIFVWKLGIFAWGMYFLIPAILGIHELHIISAILSFLLIYIVFFLISYLLFFKKWNC